MIAVIFEVSPASGQAKLYLDLAAALRSELERIDGFISIERFESLSQPGKLLSLSFWRDEAAVAVWRNRPAHRATQARARSGVFEGYRLRIAKVSRDYGLNDRDQAPDDSRIAHEARAGPSRITALSHAAPSRTLPVKIRSAQVRKPNMTYSTRVCCDADSHIMETLDWVTKFADPTIRERLPALSLGAAGNATEKFIRKAEARLEDAEKTAAIDHDVIGGPKGWAAYGAFDIAERRRALDDLGFSRQLVFSTFSGTQYLSSDDPDILYGGIRAHNRAMAHFCNQDTRLIAVGQVSLSDPVRALEEVQEGLTLGVGAFWVPASPAGATSPGHPDIDPVWQALSDAKVPFVLHIGAGTRVLPKPYEKNGKPRPTDLLGGGENLRVKDYMVLPFAAQMFLSAIVFDGVFERFPTLRGGVIELGAGWVPDFLRRLDLAHRAFRKSDPSVAGLSLTPSEYIRRQVRFTPFPGEDVGRMIRDAGPELFLFSSDYPHPEGTTDPIGRFERTFEGLGEDAKEMFYRRNFEEMMGAG